MMDELGRVLRNVLALLKRGGVICFFPSYAYAQQVWERWQQSGQLRALQALTGVHGGGGGGGGGGAVFREEGGGRCASPSAAQGGGDDGEGGACKGVGAAELLARYGAAVGAEGSRGALLLCVVGGQLSEGINFADELGRCVVMVGLPYANPSDAELQERMRWAQQQQQQQQRWRQQAARQPQPAVCTQVGGGGGDAGQAYYERLCMRAVNQCIGRAIRHRHDHAAVLLLDQRYARARTLRSLPTWITGGGGGGGPEGELGTGSGSGGRGGASSSSSSSAASSSAAAAAANPASSAEAVAPQVVLAHSYGVAQQSLARFFRQAQAAAAAAAAADDGSSSSGED
jgi:chromosome transmission fidelity protein 1